MKIAYIGQKGIPAKLGGVERYVEEVAVRMAGKGHEVFAYVRNNYTAKEIVEYKGVKLIHLPSISTKNLDAISHTFLATVHALFCDYDVVHYNSIGPTSLSFILRFLKWKTRIISTFQCQDYMHKKWGALARAYLRISEYLTCVTPHKTIVVSQLLKDRVREKYSREAVLIPNGSSAYPTDSSDELDAWGLEKKKYILSVSRLIRHKGLQYLIEAYNNLHKINRHEELKLVIVGDGFYTDEYVQYLKKMAEGNKDIIFTGLLTGKPLFQLYSHSYVFIQPSESEGLSLALLEAMGYSRPVLASDIPENMQAIGDVGFHFKNKDAKDLEAKLLRIISDKKSAEKVGVELKDRADKDYSWDNIVSEIENLYQKTRRK